MSSFKVVDPDNIVFRLEMKFTLKQWIEIRDALGKSDSAHYGAIGSMREEIFYMINQAEATWYPQPNSKAKVKR